MYDGWTDDEGNSASYVSAPGVDGPDGAKKIHDYEFFSDEEMWRRIEKLLEE